MNNEIKNLEKLLDFDLNNKNFIIDNIIDHHFKINNNTVDISNEIFKDTNILNWGENIPTLQGSKKLFINLVEIGKEKEFKKYLKLNESKILMWLNRIKV